MSNQLIYFADPMCSWCWGFSPAIEAVRARFGDPLPVRLIMGGLRPGTTEVMDDNAKRSIREHWEHVHEASGQPFDFDFFDRDGFVYDTEPACRAVVAARGLAGNGAFRLLARLHRAFYQETRDVTDRNVLCDVAAEAGLDRDGFAAAFDAEATRTETRTDFAISQRSGISGFPTLVLGNDQEGYGVVTVGYQPGERVTAVIEGWLEEQAEAASPSA